ESSPTTPGHWEATLEAFKPSAKIDWILYVAIAMGAIGLFLALIRTSKWKPVLASLSIVLAIGFLIKPIDNPTFALWGLPGLCGAGLIAWLLLEPLATRRPGASLPLSFMVLFTGLAMFTEKTGGISLALTYGALSGVCGAALVVAWLNPKLSFAGGATPMLAAIPPTALWLQAWYYYGDAPWYAFPLMLLVIPLLWLGEIPLVTKRPPWVGVLIRASLVAIPAVIAIVLAMSEQPTDSYLETYG
ncbi:MAG: hypothetical protein O7G85_05095, partial [Planctomycetota bacterium]|nr:hypothetical protein [Planctomycetota bacterium]